jgi:hypothetical protein
MAPTVTLPLPTLTPRNSASPPRSTSAGGDASRIFSVGIKVIPPASSRASGVAASTALTSARLAGRW